jgi:hypothetical protein
VQVYLTFFQADIRGTTEQTWMDNYLYLIDPEGGERQILKLWRRQEYARVTIKAGRDYVLCPPRESDPQKLFLRPKKDSLRRFSIENISWAQVTFLGVGIARAGAMPDQLGGRRRGLLLHHRVRTVLRADAASRQGVLSGRSPPCSALRCVWTYRDCSLEKYWRFPFKLCKSGPD